MYDAYQFVSGPLVWVALLFFVGGSLYRLIAMALLAKEKDGLVYAYMRPKYALRSILHWIVPFASTNSRKHPLLTVVTFLFHLSLILLPIFLLAHIILVDESWQLSWWFLPPVLADAMAFVVLAACVFFLVRRLSQPEVRFLTGPSDFVILAIVAAPFVTGIWSYYQWAGFRWMTIAHMFSGELMLAVIPFTRLSHMLFFPFTRGYMGSEFGGVRHARDW